VTQRRTPSGQGPARRPAPAGRNARAAASGRASQSAGRGGTGRAASPRTDPARSANRPAAARTRAAAGAAKRTTAPQPRRLTGRAMTLIAVLIALALAYTYPVRVYLSQQSDIARMESAQKAQRDKISALTVQAALWRDPDYIRIQAKSRFFMVYPGEVPLLVLSDPEGAARDAGRPLPTGDAAEPDPWYGTLWSSIQAANAAGSR
jgi:cell division protein FtsB